MRFVGAVYDRAYSGNRNPASWATAFTEGWLRQLRKCREATEAAQTGWSLTT